MSRMFSCANCLHYMCCDDPCGGVYWKSRYRECSVCGRRVDAETMDCEDRCPECAEAAEDEGGEE